MSRRRHLICCCCGGDAGIHKQHWNRDVGYGICPRCVEIELRQSTPTEIAMRYGTRGIHWSGPEVAEKPATERVNDHAAVVIHALTVLVEAGEAAGWDVCAMNKPVLDAARTALPKVREAFAALGVALFGVTQDADNNGGEVDRRAISMTIEDAIR